MHSCLILAAGKGERLGLVDRPKPMVVADEKPLLAAAVNELMDCRLKGKNINIVVGHMGNVIRDYFKNDVSITQQKILNGNGGAFFSGVEELSRQRKIDEDDILVIQGDDCAFNDSCVYKNMLHSHDRHDNDMTILLHKTRDADVHNIKYLVGNENKVLGTNRNHRMRGAYFIGAFVIKGALAKDLHTNLDNDDKGSEISLTAVMQNVISSSSLQTGAVIAKGPWKSINDRQGLLMARYLKRSPHSGKYLKTDC